MTIDDLPATMPIFPLGGALLLPNGLLPLNIFEGRYIQMINDAMMTKHRLIGMIQPDQLARDNGDKEAILNIGCAGRIVQFSETEDDRYMIMIQGVSRFTVMDELSTVLPYRQVSADWNDYHDDMVEDCDTIEIDRESFLPLLKNYLDLNKMDVDWHLIENAPCEILLTNLPMICPFDAQEKQALLEAKSMDKRYENLSTLLKIKVQSSSDNQSIKH